MAYTSAYAVVVGAATKKTDIDGISTNTDYLQTLANVDHDFHVSTGTGYHKASHTAPVHLYNGTDHAILILDSTDPDPGKWQLRMKCKAGSAPTAAAKTEGRPFAMGGDSGTAPAPSF